MQKYFLFPFLCGRTLRKRFLLKIHKISVGLHRTNIHNSLAGKSASPSKYHDVHCGLDNGQLDAHSKYVLILVFRTQLHYSDF